MLPDGYAEYAATIGQVFKHFSDATSIAAELGSVFVPGLCAIATVLKLIDGIMTNNTNADVGPRLKLGMV